MHKLRHLSTLDNLLTAGNPCGENLNRMKLFKLTTPPPFFSTCLAITSSSTICKVANVCIAFVIGMSLWTMCFGPACFRSSTCGRIITTTHQSEMCWIHARLVAADMINRGFVMTPCWGSDRNVPDKKLVREPMRSDLSFVVLSETLNDQSVSESVFGSSPNPAAVFGERDAVNESVKQGCWYVSSWHSGNKNPVRQSEVKWAHERPQPKDGLVNVESCFGHFKAEAIISDATVNTS